MPKPEDERTDEAERRQTEQGDPLPPEHSIAHRRGEPEKPYRPARQPAQKPPDEEEGESSADG